MMASALFANHWTPITGTQYNLTMNGVIIIDGVEQMGTNLEVGAFCDDECRGSMLPEFFQPTGQYVVALTVVSNVVSGETITFRLFDHSINEELDLVSLNSITFHNNDVIGTIGDWFEFSFETHTTTQTYTLPIIGYESENPVDYYLIAPPFDDIDPTEIEGMTTEAFDLYYFDQAQELEWVNYKSHAFNLESGKGYLYAHNTDVTLSFTGVPYNGDGKVTLRKTGGLELEGWNLVGNPFGGSTATIDRPFYVMKADGTDIIASTSRTIRPMQGVFVIARTDNEVMTFTPTPGGSSNWESILALDLVRNDRSETLVDRAIVRFDEGDALPKITLDTSNTHIYIPHDGADYAVVGRSNENTMPVSFKAMENGSYTLKVETTDVDVDYLHLVDNKTGNDVDLLVAPSYTFDAYITDATDRFSLVFFTTTGLNESGFAFFNGKAWNIISEGNATLQVIDVAGRLLSTESLNGNTEINISQPAGVYLLRLVRGNEVKVQKVVLH